MQTERSAASARWALMQRHWVRVDGRPFLRRRQIVQTPWFSLLLTRIYGPDTGRDPHDHSRWFLSLRLSGRYRETVFTDPGDLSACYTAVRHRWTAHVMPADRAHVITEVTAPLRTLVFAGRHRGTWSFWTMDGKIDWKDY